MDLRFEAEVGEPVDWVRRVLEDLGTYPEWLSIVQAAEPVGDGSWTVELGLQIGPMKQTKRVRMVRDEATAPGVVRFVRDERDGEDHPAWVLTATLDDRRGTTGLTMHLHYGGGPSLPFLDSVLAGEASRAAARLGALASHRAD